MGKKPLLLIYSDESLLFLILIESFVPLLRTRGVHYVYVANFIARGAHRRKNTKEMMTHHANVTVATV